MSVNHCFKSKPIFDAVLGIRSRPSSSAACTGECCFDGSKRQRKSYTCDDKMLNKQSKMPLSIQTGIRMRPSLDKQVRPQSCQPANLGTLYKCDLQRISHQHLLGNQRSPNHLHCRLWKHSPQMKRHLQMMPNWTTGKNILHGRHLQRKRSLGRQKQEAEDNSSLRECIQSNISPTVL